MFLKSLKITDLIFKIAGFTCAFVICHTQQRFAEIAHITHTPCETAW